MTGQSDKIVVMGASAGGITALSTVFSLLPEGFRLPIVIVIHIPPDKTSYIDEILATKCRLQVKEAEDKEMIRDGFVYIAPPDYHLLIEKNGSLSLSNEEAILFSRPSIDLLFETAADAYGGNLIGIVLSGANNDGATGLKAVIDSGGIGLVQAPHLAQAAVMPECAIALCPAASVLSLEQIAHYLQEIGT